MSEKISPIHYKYNINQQIQQTLTFSDFMCAYKLVICLRDVKEATNLWNTIIRHIDHQIFQDFASFNATILDAIQEHKQTYTISGHKRSISPQPQHPPNTFPTDDALNISFDQLKIDEPPPNKKRVRFS